MANETFDVAVGMRRDVMDRAIDKLYKQLYPKYFKGDADAGSGRQVFYDVKSAPTLDFLATAGTAAAVREELAKIPKPAGAPANEAHLLEAPPMSLQAFGAALDAKSVKVRFDKIDITIKSSKGEAKTTAAAIVTIGFEIEYPERQPARVKFVVRDAKATTPNPDDQYILNTVVIPAMKKLAGQVMSAIQLPPMISIAGIQFDLPEPRIIGDYFVILAKLLSRHFPLGLDAPIPGGNPEAFLVLSPQMMQIAFDTATRGLTHVEQASGSKDLTISTAYYEAKVVVSDIKGVATGAEFPLSAKVEGSAKGWITTFLGDPTAYFGARPIPSPVVGRVALGVEGNKINARISSVNTFSIDIYPTGGAISDVIDFVLSPLKGFATLFMPRLVNYLKGVKFDVLTVPDLPLAYDGIGVTIRPKDLRLASAGQHLNLTGGVTLL